MYLPSLGDGTVPSNQRGGAAVQEQYDGPRPVLNRSCPIRIAFESSQTLVSSVWCIKLNEFRFSSWEDEFGKESVFVYE